MLMAIIFGYLPLDVAGNLFVTGKFSGTKKFGETTLNQSNDGFFMAKLGNATSETFVVKTGLNQFRAYPNPFSDKVQIKFQSHVNTNARIDIYDATGRKLKTLLNQYVSAKQENEVEFIPESGTSGLYLCKITLNDKVYHVKLIRH